jgi:hypothetical protein
MKYEIRENADHTHTLYRNGEVAIPRGGRPNNAELEFWLEIEELREKLQKAEETQLRLQNLCRDVRNAVNQYHRSHLQNDLDTLETLVAQCNQPWLIELPPGILHRLAEIAELGKDTEARRIVAAINEIRNSDEGMEIHIPNDKVDFGPGPNTVISVSTDFNLRPEDDHGFQGENLGECLQKALTWLKGNTDGEEKEGG